MHHGRVDGVVERRQTKNSTPGRDCSGDMTWATKRAASGGRSSPGVDDARLERADDRRTGVTSPPGAKSAPMPTAFVGLNCWGVAPRDPAAGVAARRAESARFSARSWRDRASGVVAMGDGASMSAGSSPTVGAAASRRRCAWRLAFFAWARARFSADVTRASPLGAGIYLGGSSHVEASVSGLCLRCRRRVSTRRGDGVKRRGRVDGALTGKPHEGHWSKTSTARPPRSRSAPTVCRSPRRTGTLSRAAPAAF